MSKKLKEKNRKIVITGSEGIIGSELCKYFEKTDNVKKLDIKLGHDLLNESFVKNWFKNNKSDYLINCFALNDHVSSIKKKSTLYDSTLESFSCYLQTNLIALFSVCREFARNSKIGSIINFSSIYGSVSPNPTLYNKFHKDIGYGVSKAGVLNLTKYLAVHLAPKIRVNSIIPGGIELSQDQKFVKNYSKLVPMNRMMKKTELNGLVDYLCSKNSSYITGSAIAVDGGYMAW